MPAITSARESSRRSCKYRVEDRKLDAAHHIVIDNLEFGAKTDSKDAAPIPLKLAVALLKDRNGVIDVNLPVTGTLDDPKFRLGPIIWKAVLGLLTKIVTAPFAALGALFGGVMNSRMSILRRALLCWRRPKRRSWIRSPRHSSSGHNCG